MQSGTAAPLVPINIKANSSGTITPNLVKNSGSSNSLDGWNVRKGITLEPSENDGVRISGTQQSGWSYAVISLFDPHIEPGAIYRLEAWMNVDDISDATYPPYLKLGISDKDGEIITNYNTNKYDLINKGTWQKLWAEFTVDSNAYTGTVSIEKGTKNSLSAILSVKDIALAQVHEINITETTNQKDNLSKNAKNKSYQYLWTYISSKLENKKDVDLFRSIAKTASKSGYNGIVLSSGFDLINLKSERYLSNLKEVKEICKDFGLEIIPMVFSVGYGSGVLAHNKNLAVGFPVKNMDFQVKKVCKPVNLFLNSSFETFKNNRAYDYGFHDRPSEISYIDSEIRHSGHTSMRFQNFTAHSSGNGRVFQNVKVIPDTEYNLSCWIKTENLSSKGSIMMQVFDETMKRIAKGNISAKPTSDWTKFYTRFNSAQNTKLRVYMGIWNGDTGKFWIDDISLSPLNSKPSTSKRIIAESAEAVKQIKNGGFEIFKGNNAAEFRFHDKPGIISYIDNNVFHDGNTSLRFENFSSENRHGRVCKTIDVIAFRQYILSCWIKTEEFKQSGDFMLQIYSVPKKEEKNMKHLGLKKFSMAETEEWTKVDVCFNSMDNNQVCFFGGTWHGENGSFWIDDINLNQGSMLNLLRREGTPLTIKLASGEILKEGSDYRYLEDNNLNFKSEHTSPVVEILSENKVKQGDKLSVSFYHGLSWGKSQVCISMSEEEVYEIWKKQLSKISNILTPDYYFLHMDEIRQGGTDKSDLKRDMTMAKILGNCITKQYNLIKQTNSNAKVVIWSDMLDPNHNAHQDYCQARGDFTNSLDYIPKDIKIVCWNFNKRKLSTLHFTKKGFQIIGAVYYDDPNLDSSISWLKTLAEYNNAIGIMFTTWQNNYDLLDNFGVLLNE